MTSEKINAAAAGTWRLGDLTVNRLGFGTMRLTGSGAFDQGTPSDRDRSIPGTGDPDHLVENVAAGAISLSDDELALLG